MGSDPDLPPTVLTLGTGGVSSWGLKLAKLAGAKVVITSSSDAKLERMKALGANIGINYKTNRNWGRKVVELTDGRGADIVLETAGDKHPVLASWRWGLGRVTALTTEPTGPGTEPWREWHGYGPFLARVLTRTASDQRDPYRFSLTRAGTR